MKALRGASSAFGSSRRVDGAGYPFRRRQAVNSTQTSSIRSWWTAETRVCLNCRGPSPGYPRVGPRRCERR
eukprot:9455290-Lingulodinium_polyedra.AAC.1